MRGAAPRSHEVEELVAAYRADLVEAGMFSDHPVTSPARTFLARVGAKGWEELSLEAQCILPLKERRVVGWLIVTGRVQPSPDYLVACRPYLGEIAARHQATFHERFRAASSELGFDPTVSRLQWSALVKVAACSGTTPTVSEPVARVPLLASTTILASSRSARRVPAPGFGLGSETRIVFECYTGLPSSLRPA